MKPVFVTNIFILLKQLRTLILVIVVFSCSKNESPSFLFETVTSDHSNIRFKNVIPENELTNSFVYEYVYNGGGVAIGDVNNDGLDDIYFTSNLGDNKLYLNKGNLEFEDITKISGTADNRGWTTGVNMVDINHDGLLDIYVCKSGPFDRKDLLSNKLYINKGNNKKGIPVFKDEASSFGFNNVDYSIQSAFFDYDQDGDLDMYLMNHNPQTYGEQGTETFSVLGDKFFVNENGKFVDKTKEVGIYSNAISYGLGIGVSDLNLDGWPDIYISNDYYERDYMYLNQQDGTFKEVIKTATNHISTFSMGNDIADFNNDGFTDIITLDMVSEDNYGMKTSMASMNPEKFVNNVKMGRHYQYMYNSLQKNSTYIDSLGTPFFSDIGQMTGVSNTDWSWAPLFADFDNDGLKDIFITNGIKRDFRNKDFFNSLQTFRKQNKDALTNPKKINSLIQKTPNRPYKNYFFKNEGGLKFVNATSEWTPNASKTFSNGAAYADLDNDGDLDVVINNVDEEAIILKNNSDKLLGNYIGFQFKGLPKNTDGIGAKVTVYLGEDKQVFENYVVRGYQSSVPAKIHVGLGEVSKIDSVIVQWPNNKIQKLQDLEVNKLLTINYNEKNIGNNMLRLSKETLFSKLSVLSGLEHIENTFDDYEKQILLPHKMSQFGPAIAVADINGDGREDIYMGQSTGTASAIFTQDIKGEFVKLQTFDDDAIYEDIDAKFFDYDLDGDLDLYVACGGNEFEANSPNYADRLYENRSGKFVKRMDLLPKDNHMSSSRVKISDYDNNGYPDLFVGGRLIPHDYPSPASSVLLANNKGQFKNVSSTVAPDFKDLGIVTDASWTDFDKDGDLDLCVIGEWMAPTFFENNDNTFKKLNSTVLDSLSGWYYAIKPIDIDNDGDEDYILGNLGENYKYKANNKEPFEVYYHDFDENGKKDLVLGYYNFGELFPVRGRECSSQQMPSIKKITPTYDDFGKSTIADIYSTNSLNAALHLSCYNFKSGILKNNGNLNFEFIPLPEMAQISSINDVLLEDVDNDGDKDLIVAGNLFTSEIETPRNDAGYGLVLLNEGSFKFKTKHAKESGFFVPSDVKHLKSFKINKIPVVLAASNNNSLQVFKLNGR